MTIIELIFSAITALATAVLAIFTYRLAVETKHLVADSHASAAENLKLAKIQMQAELLVNQEAAYSSERMRRLRKRAAGYLRAITAYANDDGCVDDVCSFFDTLGMLTRMEYIYQEMCWSVFAYDAMSWWDAAREYVAEAQAEDPSYFCDFQWLRDEFYRHETVARKRPAESVDFSPQEVAEFLKYEFRL